MFFQNKFLIVVELKIYLSQFKHLIKIFQAFFEPPRPNLGLNFSPVLSRQTTQNKQKCRDNIFLTLPLPSL